MDELFAYGLRLPTQAPSSRTACRFLCSELLQATSQLLCPRTTPAHTRGNLPVRQRHQDRREKGRAYRGDDAFTAGTVFCIFSTVGRMTICHGIKLAAAVSSQHSAMRLVLATSPFASG